jgi:hypothetical protein
VVSDLWPERLAFMASGSKPSLDTTHIASVSIPFANLPSCGKTAENRAEMPVFAVARIVHA